MKCAIRCGVAAMAMLLTACASNGPATDPCGPWAAIWVAREDVLTDGTARAVLTHNETGRQLCGWGR